MSIFDTMEKRHHVRKYKPEAIPEETVKKLLWQSWKISPSKNNFMPYTVNVLGPNSLTEKKKIWENTIKSHRDYEEDIGNKTANKHIAHKYKFKINPNYEHIKFNSHLLAFTSRVCSKPNKFYQRMVLEQGHFAEQCEVDQVLNIAEATSVEVGFFATHLTGLCIENNIDVSFCACIRKSPTGWDTMPWSHYDKERKKTRILLLMSLGYGDTFRYDVMKNDGNFKDDIKPEMDEVVKWI
jgi:hypothetical protein